MSKLAPLPFPPRRDRLALAPLRTRSKPGSKPCSTAPMPNPPQLLHRIAQQVARLEALSPKHTRALAAYLASTLRTLEQAAEAEE